VLDNCEHLVLACAVSIAALLRDCPDLHVLATSREAVSVPGEVTWQVHPLDLPESHASVDRIARAPAARLLVDRANAVLPISVTASESEAFVRICAYRDGIPLALELAAARLRALSVHELADRLESNPGLLASRSRTGRPQHQTLRATIEWSVVLLDSHEQLLFQRLAVFSGTWSLPLAEDVCSGPGIERSEVLDLLARLVEKSMLIVDVRSGSARVQDAGADPAARTGAFRSLQ